MFRIARRFDVLLPLAVALAVFAARAWLIDAWGSPVPFWDQWGVESKLYRAWLTDTLRAADLIAPHNEHRILLTRVADLVLFILCGGWNPWAQLLLNAALHATIAGVLVAVFSTVLPAIPRALVAIGITLIFTATAGWQNALWGFQSSVYFTHLFAVLAFAGLAFARSYHVRWWLALGALVVSLFGNAAGLLAAIAALAVVWPPHQSRRTWVALCSVAAVIAFALILRVSAPHHESLQVRTLGQFIEVFSRCLSWPHVNSPWAWVALQLPLAVLCVRRWTRGDPLNAAERFAVGLGLFAVLQAAAVAYSRGAGLLEYRPLSRYQDPFFLGAAAQDFAAIVLAVELGRRGRLLCLGWSAVMLGGLLQLTTTNLSLNLPFKRALDAENLMQVRTYVTTGDPAALASDQRHHGIYNDYTIIQRVLDDPILQPVLPRPLFSDEPPGSKPWPVTASRELFMLSLLVLGLMLLLSIRSGRPAAKFKGRSLRRSDHQSAMSRG